MLCETWSINDEAIELPGYTTFSNNRSVLHSAACVGSSGVAILLDGVILQEFKVDSVDLSYEGIVLVILRHHSCDTTIAFVCCYAPPEHSSRGSEADAVFEHFIQILYQYENVDDTFVW